MAPCLARQAAIAFPIPLAAPVITADLSVSRNMLKDLCENSYVQPNFLRNTANGF
jgi:hypothetical protein